MTIPERNYLFCRLLFTDDQDEFTAIYGQLTKKNNGGRSGGFSFRDITAREKKDKVKTDYLTNPKYWDF